MPPPNRYLVSFDARRTFHRFTDVLVIGAGIAGLRAALEVPADLDVLVVTKDRVTESNSTYAQGGIAGVLSPEDRFENHIEDTLVAGDGLCDPRRRRAGRPRGPGADRHARPLGHQVRPGERRTRPHPRGRATATAASSTPSATPPATRSCGPSSPPAKAAPNVTLWDDTFTIDLLTHEGRCVGAVVLAEPASGTRSIWAKQVILASGGCGMVYRETTNPPVATGDGMAAAYRAGAELRDMEFMQFHPTVLYVAGSARYLISEAVRGEGAYLRDVNGERFMPADDPRAELAPRDVVARAIFRTMERTQHPNVYLDLSHLDPAMVADAVPRHRQGVPGVRPGHHDATASRSGPGRTTWSAA